MTTISHILESVVLDDDEVKPLSRNIMKSFSLYKVIHHNKAPLSTITFWQWKIAEYIYMTYRRGIGCSDLIDINRVQVDKDMKLIESTIIDKVYDIDETSEARLIKVILELHMSIFRIVTLKHYGPDKYLPCALMRTFGNYFYSAVVCDTTRKLNLLEVVRYSEMLHKVTVLGLFDEIDGIITAKSSK